MPSSSLRLAAIHLGPQVAEFEAAAAAACAVPHAIGCASGTDAIWLALAAAEYRPGRRGHHDAIQLLRQRQCDSALRRTALSGRYRPATFNLSAAAAEEVFAPTRRKDQGHPAGSPLRPVRRLGCLHALDRSDHDLLLSRTPHRPLGPPGTELRRSAGRCGRLQLLPHEEPQRDGRAGLVTTVQPRSTTRPRASRSRHAPPLLSRRDWLELAGWTASRPPFSR